MSVIISKSGKNATRLERSVIQQEDYLQKYIYDNPESLPLHELKEGLRLLILTREFAVSSGYIDALGVDEEGNIYVIETKLYKNPDKRLVIAQMLDYGASLWRSYADPGLFVDQLEQEVTKGFGLGLGPKLCEYYGFEAETISGYLDGLKQNVKNGAFRFVVLMDKMDDRLKDLISFVNSNSRFEILGVELEFYKHTEFEIIIPKLFGAEQRKAFDAGLKSQIRWDKDKFFSEMHARRTLDEIQVIKRLFDWAEEKKLSMWWGSGARTGSFSPLLSHEGHDYYLFVGYTYASIEINFGMLQKRPAFQDENIRLELLNRLNAVPGVLIGEKVGSTDTIMSRPSIRGEALVRNNSTEKLLEVFDWMLALINAKASDRSGHAS
jgi:hypothetical protein